MSSVHKKHNKLVHLLKSEGERGEGEWGWIVLNGKKEKGEKKWREREGGVRERERWGEYERER